MKRSMMNNLFLVALSGLSLVLALSQTTFSVQQQKTTKVEIAKDIALNTTTFTYQGELKDATGPVTGLYDLRFTLYSAQAGGQELGSVIHENQALTNGLFSLKLDFGRAALDAPEGWLEIAVRPSGSTEEYAVLFPRQKLTPVPSAILAQHEQWSLIGVPVGVADRAVVDRVADVDVTDEAASKSKDDAKPTVETNVPNEASAAAEPEQQGTWVKMGSVVSLADNNDRVAIGTTTPEPGIKLHVTGPVLADGLRIGSNQFIVSGGNVGIGTTTPNAKLEVKDGIIRVDAGLNRDSRIDFYQNGIRRWEIGNDIDDNITGQSGINFFSIAASGRPGTFTILQNGNVGIGTTNPATLLHLHSITAQLSLGNPEGRRWSLYSTPTNSMEGSGAFSIIDSTADARRLTISEAGNVGIGTTSPGAKLDVAGMARARVLEITGGSDIAEPFKITGTETIQPGMLVAIDPSQPGQLRTADKAYDRTVAGILSGANGINPGLTLKQEGSAADGSHLVALSGRVYCWADASYGSIQPGDMLTTSDTPGHAMKVKNHKKAQGAIIGKAMTELKQGKGLVLVLVTLQ